jgi:hypothetical protein
VLHGSPSSVLYLVTSDQASKRNSTNCWSKCSGLGMKVEVWDDPCIYTYHFIHFRFERFACGEISGFQTPIHVEVRVADPQAVQTGQVGEWTSINLLSVL